MESKKEHTTSSIFTAIIATIIPILGFLIFLSFTIDGVRDMEHYRRVYQNPLTVTATVTHYESYDDEGDTDFYSYIRYTANGKEYTDIRYEDKDAKTDLTPIGQEIQVQVSPEDPSRLMSSLFHSNTSLIGCFFSASIISFCISFLRGRPLKEHQFGIPDNDMVRNDIKIAIRSRPLRPFWLLLWVAFLFCCLRYPMLYGIGWKITCGVFFLFWLYCMYTTTRDYRMAENGEYTLQRSCLERKQVITDSDGPDTYRLHYRNGELTWYTDVDSRHYNAAHEGDTALAVYLTGTKTPILHYHTGSRIR